VRAAEAGALALLLLLFAGCSGETEMSTAAAPATAPAAQPPAPVAAPRLEFLSGETRTLAEFQGQYLFVNYWAEWCGPCLDEIPELNELHEEAMDAFVVGINFDRLTPEEMRPQVEALGIHFPVAVDDPAAVLGLETPEVLPSTFVFDPAGAMVAVLRGPQTLESLRAAMTAAP